MFLFRNCDKRITCWRDCRVTDILMRIALKQTVFLLFLFAISYKVALGSLWDKK